MRTRYTPITADQRLRDLRKDFKLLQREEPSPGRAARLATFAREAHRDRQLNMAMHAAQLCLDDDPDDPDELVAAYVTDEGSVEDRLRALSDLRDLARYVDRPDVLARADSALDEQARAWVRDGDGQERRHRLRTLTSLAGRELADRIRDELEFLS